MITDQEWLDHFEQFEGRVNHFYLDGEGLVTIGIGCRVWAPTTLNLFRKSDDQMAAPADVNLEFNIIKAKPADRTPDFYGQACHLYLKEPDIDSLFIDRLGEFIKQVNTSILQLDTIPDPAGMVLVDMALNLGTDRLIKSFPRFIAAMKSHDWATAATECHRQKIQESRNVWAKKMLESLISKEN